MNGANVHVVGPRRKLTVGNWISPQCQLPRASLFREKDGTGAPRGRLSRVNYLGSRAFRATRGSRAPTILLCNRGRLPDRHRLLRRVFLNPLLAGQLCGRLNDIAMPLLSLDLGGGFSVDSICHLADCPGLAIQRTFDELFSNAPYFADALRIVLVNRLCEPNSQLISKLLPYQRSVLVLCTDEFFLDRVSVDRFLQGATFQTSFFTDVFLGLSYHDGCIPVFHFASSDGTETLKLQPSLFVARYDVFPFAEPMIHEYPSDSMIQLILKRASLSRPSGQWNDDDYDVLAMARRLRARVWNARSR